VYLAERLPLDDRLESLRAHREEVRAQLQEKRETLAALAHHTAEAGEVDRATTLELVRREHDLKEERRVLEGDMQSRLLQAVDKMAELADTQQRARLESTTADHTKLSAQLATQAERTRELTNTHHALRSRIARLRRELELERERTALLGAKRRVASQSVAALVATLGDVERDCAATIAASGTDGGDRGSEGTALRAFDDPSGPADFGRGMSSRRALTVTALAGLDGNSVRQPDGVGAGADANDGTMAASAASSSVGDLDALDDYDRRVIVPTEDDVDWRGGGGDGAAHDPDVEGGSSADEDGTYGSDATTPARQRARMDMQYRVALQLRRDLDRVRAETAEARRELVALGAVYGAAVLGLGGQKALATGSAETDASVTARSPRSSRGPQTAAAVAAPSAASGSRPALEAFRAAAAAAAVSHASERSIGRGGGSTQERIDQVTAETVLDAFADVARALRSAADAGAAVAGLSALHATAIPPSPGAGPSSSRYSGAAATGVVRAAQQLAQYEGACVALSQPGTPEEPHTAVLDRVDPSARARVLAYVLKRVNARVAPLLQRRAPFEIPNFAAVVRQGIPSHG
jgi:hypothetical protein